MAFKIQFSEEQIEEMKEMYLNDLSYQKIADKFNVSQPVIIRVLEDFAKENPRNLFYKIQQDKKNKFTDEEIKLMKDMYLKKYSYKKIAEYFKTSYLTISKELKDFAKENPRNMNNSIEFSEEQIKQMEEYYLQGLSYCKIANKFGVSQGLIMKRLKNFAIKNPRNVKNKSNLTYSEKELIEIVKKMYLEGNSCKKICEELHISIYSTNKYLNMAFN